jgi:hypothetical protein
MRLGWKGLREVGGGRSQESGVRSQESGVRIQATEGCRQEAGREPEEGQVAGGQIANCKLEGGEAGDTGRAATDALQEADGRRSQESGVVERRASAPCSGVRSQETVGKEVRSQEAGSRSQEPDEQPDATAAIHQNLKTLLWRFVSPEWIDERLG